MALAIDFGTCNTVIAQWREGHREAAVIRVDGLSRRFTHRLPGGGEVGLYQPKHPTALNRNASA